ncbi:WD40 repeat-like protein [Daedaleopsis nitida]|nr:WD40 repeat-like protein [Daedaleopsis nitida]
MSDQSELASPPFDSVSSVRFSPTNPSHLLVSSWDTTVRFYDVATNEQKSKYDHRAAVLACCFSDASHAFSGGWTPLLDLSTEKINHLGQHSDAISSINYSRDYNTLVSGSWDRTVRLWDPRASNPQTHSQELPERVYNMDLVNHILVVAMASRLFHIYDLRKMDAVAQTRESSLKFMTRALACMPDGQGEFPILSYDPQQVDERRRNSSFLLGYASGSVEGRIAVEYFDTSPQVQEKKYAFKCHRQAIDDVDHVWPVNALAFHPVYNTFASAGSDGTVSIWDHKSKKRLRQYPKYPAAVPSIAFNCDGTKLAVGVSYTWEEGEEGAKTAERPAVFVKNVGEEVKVRRRCALLSVGRHGANLASLPIQPKGWTAPS